MSEDDRFLDQASVADIASSRKLFEQRRQFHWEFYSYLAFQRDTIYDFLKSSLRERATPFEFSRWQRIVKYKYALAPLSTKGSLLDPGGRFNIGAIDKTRYPLFAALYIASDRSTALAELLGQTSSGTSLTAEEVALTKPDSIAAVSVSGKLEAVLDLRNGEKLEGFVTLIRGFKLSTALSARAKALDLPPLELVKTVERLTEELRKSNWRNWPTLFDVPAPCQIFGRIALDAEIEGILYTSALTARPCLVLYPQNFRHSPSYIELDDPVPTDMVQRRIDATNCQDSP